MRFLKNHFKILFIAGSYLLAGICDRDIPVNPPSALAVKLDTKETLHSQSAPQIKRQFGSGLLPSKLPQDLNQATNQRQTYDVKNREDAPNLQTGIECHGIECPKDHKAAINIPQKQLPQNNATKEAEIPLVENGIYWSREVEGLLPKGLTEEQYDAWRSKVSRLPVIYMEEGTLTKCGRDGNAYAILSDGTQVCVRHSKHGNTGLLGELFAFRLSRFLQMQNVPAIVLSKISTNENSTWAGQRSQTEGLGWADGNFVALIQWIPGLTEARFPSMIQNEPYMLKSDDSSMNELDTPSLVTLVDWTDLVVFDYITAHIDRMTIIYDAIWKTGQKWLIKNPIHNLAKSTKTGALCIFDNECAFFASYPVLMSKNFGKNVTDMYDSILGSVCIFRRSTVEAVRKLAEIDDIGGFLSNKLREDPSSAIFLKEAFNGKVSLHVKVKERILKVLNHIQKCQGLVGEGEI